jgi:hypothetical protein
MAADVSVLQFTESQTSHTIGQGRALERHEILRSVWESLREDGENAFDPWGWTIPLPHAAQANAADAMSEAA